MSNLNRIKVCIKASIQIESGAYPSWLACDELSRVEATPTALLHHNNVHLPIFILTGGSGILPR
jgi:hypothetical protein